MILVGIIGVILLIIYFLLIKGYLFKGILAFTGCLFIYNLLNNYSWAKNGIIINNYNVSFSAILPGIILLLAMAFTYED